MFRRSTIRLASFVAAAFLGASAMAETPEEWVKLGARVHGGFGAFIPVGIRTGLDAAEALKAKPRELTVTYFDNPKSPCACFADGIAIATVASVGQRTVTIAPEVAPADVAAVIVIRRRDGGQGLRYVIPMGALPKLAQMNKTLEPIQRYHAVMKADGLFTRSLEP
ncbi:MAG: formylmethanofuran dehydrogenase subunit E family protein [Beijerinckiaceae bacterium]|nr:formylmethanofuran dehydrogenase subunit E family protein [Beijerinckiaceae bacterium]